MEDFPRNQLELEARFSTEVACREYLFHIRWPHGFRCPDCGGQKTWALSHYLLQCSHCNRQMTVTAGTIFQDSRLPLALWFRAVWWVTSQKNGVSAMELQRVLGLKSYKTAWTLLYKLRRAMGSPDQEQLSGRVEVDEAYLGGEEEDAHGCKTETKALIVVAAEEDGLGIGRIRMHCIPDASAESLVPFVQNAVAPGSVVHTDGGLGYLPLESKGYQHQVTYLKGDQKTPSEQMPRVQQVVPLLRCWIQGTLKGSVSLEHLEDYLNEYTYRFNRRKMRSKGRQFFLLLQRAVAIEPMPYKSLVRGPVTSKSVNEMM
ncbi:MAG: IS1595 family transposase [Terracidiphilus sp.]|nr:IS1595 family transposase [Terracidiphilus sp.]